MTDAPRYEANITRQGSVSLATQALALYTATNLPVSEIAIRLFGEDTVHWRRQVHSLINQARREAARCH